MAKMVRVNLFQVGRTAAKTQPLSVTLSEFLTQPLGSRWRDEVRLEDAVWHPADTVLPVEYFHLEFSKGRQIGPGRLSSGLPLQDIDLGEGGIFGEESTALYVPSREWLVVLNNHYGVGPSRMAAYFNALDPGNLNRHFDYTIDPMIDSHALDRMRRMERFSEIEISAKVGVFEHLENGIAESVFQAAGQSKAYRVSLKLIANEKHHTGNSLVPKVVKDLLRKALSHSEGVDRLVVKADDQALETKDKVVDLLKHKLFKQYSEKELAVSAGRYTATSKLTMLRRACRGWLSEID